MYKLFILFLLQSVLVSDSVIVNSYGQPLATSYVYRVDGNENGRGYGYEYNKNYGYGKVIVTTYLAPVPPQPMSASSYSTYIIHPINVKGCMHNNMDSENAGSFHYDYGTEKDDTKMPLMGEYEQELNTEYSEPMYDMQGNDYENMIDTDTVGDRYRGWYEDYRKQFNGKDNQDDRKKFNGEESQGYWDKLKDEFDAYYNEKYEEFFGKDENQKEDNDEDEYESEYRPPFKSGFGDDYEDELGEDDNYVVKPEFEFKPQSDGHGYRYEFMDKYGRRW